MVNKKLRIIATGLNTIVNASSTSLPVFKIDVNGNGTTIDGFIISGSTSNAGVLINGVNNVDLANLTIFNCQFGVYLAGTSQNITMESLNINGTLGQGLYLNGNFNNITLTGTDTNPSILNNTRYNAIELDYYSLLNGININHTIINNSKNYGILLSTCYSLKNINITNNTINNSAYNGIEINMANDPTNGNITLTNNNINNNNTANGLIINTRGNTSITGNNITGNGLNSPYYGLSIIGYDSPILELFNNTIMGNGNGLYLQGIINGSLQDVQLRNNTGYELYAAADTSNSLNHFTMGFNHLTKFSLDYVNGIILKGVESPANDPEKWYNINKYLSINGLGTSYCDLKIFYTAQDLVYVDEATLKMWTYDGAVWNTLTTINGVNTTGKYVYATNLYNLSVFAPFGTDLTPPSVNADLPNGTYKTLQKVNLTSVDSIDPLSTIYYRINGSTWNNQSTPVILNFSTDGTYNLEFYAIDATENKSPVQYRTYIIDTISPTATVTPIGKLYNVTQNVTVKMNEDGTLYYTTNGTDPSNLSNLYTSPINITSTTTLKFIAIDIAGNPSPIYTEVYNIDTNEPTISLNPIGGLNNSIKNVILTTSDPNSTSITYYTIDGSNPQTSNTRIIYTNPIIISKSTTLRFSATDPAGNWSPNYLEIYTIDSIPPTATATPTGGLVNISKNVILKLSENGTIYYTTNGATPTFLSTNYNGPIVLKTTATLKYFAVDLAGNVSQIYTQKYTIDKVAPKIKSTTPINKKTNYSKTSSIILKFTENIKNSSTYKNISIKNLTTKKTIKLTTAISKGTLTIKTGTRTKNTWYQVTIPKSAIKDLAGNNLTANYTFQFKTGG
ncbi:MAG: chitobiase/beta-hexosaminidase C-terminal domain-containing protein [Methanobacterium sp. ERen5]|nr:MAG: chitobiase/beta-hexosaminidase C-terminal domain-containing protein [Methanobacterium sp. ERen5]